MVALLREDYIHYTVRAYLKGRGWLLIAGQYPDGSDDELLPLNVTDPSVARDGSPDPRRHSRAKLVPDLVALKKEVVLVVEMKPKYSVADEQKLLRLLGERRSDFLNALERLLRLVKVAPSKPLRDLTVVPCLGFSSVSAYPRRSDFCYILLKEDGQCVFERGASLESL